MNGLVRTAGVGLLLCALTASRLVCAADHADPAPKTEPAAAKPAPAAQPAGKPDAAVLPQRWDALDPALLIKQVRRMEPAKLRPLPAEIHR